MAGQNGLSRPSLVLLTIESVGLFRNFFVKRPGVESLQYSTVLFMLGQLQCPLSCRLAGSHVTFIRFAHWSVQLTSRRRTETTSMPSSDETTEARLLAQLSALLRVSFTSLSGPDSWNPIQPAIQQLIYSIHSRSSPRRVTKTLQD